ncbi:N-glycosylase/DNA lyase [Hypsibius exemplaris]|uniref:N-glycosylase/DNA lyase n=1 Tax=Hypsibius exemplaris TaxID=2072580 RepID=A0A1W0XE72_HYPEX|nr:N-glycosylase/DNA lyase [Hypsibius exemplaris]
MQLDYVLACGQSFRWHKNASGEWHGVIGRKAFRLRQTNDHVEYQVFPGPSADMPAISEPAPKNRRQSKSAKETASMEFSKTPAVIDPHLSELHRYFALETSLMPLYEAWSAADERFAAVAPQFQGIRMLQQDFVETLFSFICSSNNNIQRIQQMVEKLCSNYGAAICSLDGRTFYSFPSVDRLAGKEVDGELRKLGFGYRAGFLQKSAEYITKHPEWLDQVVKADYATAKSLLMELPGVGAKVADCICLMSLGHHGVVPVDTHVFAITAEHYLPKLRDIKSVTPRVYNEIGEFYRARFGPMAGWAHSVLFTAHLARFKKKAESSAGRTHNKRKKMVTPESVGAEHVSATDCVN